MTDLTIGTYSIPVPKGATPAGSGFIVKAAKVELPLPFQPARYYRHGWQSWTLAAWVEPDRCLPPLKPRILNPMHTDPVYADDPRPNGSWLCAVKTSDGQTLLLGALSLETHTALDNGSLLGWSEGAEAEWFIAAGNEVQVFNAYAHLLGERLGRGKVRTPPHIWCSWYSLYREITEERLLNILDELEGLPFDVFQVDDGWQAGIGDWEANEKFPAGMENLAGRIVASGRTPGLWLAPLLVVPSSSIYRQHPDWLLRDPKGKLVRAGHNWNEPLYALDTTHPGALDWLSSLMQKVRAWGYDYIKLDFLYAGALPGKRFNDMPREAAYRHGLKTLRKALGDAYFLTCGTPILPSIGLCDGMRVGADVAEVWDRRLETQILDNYAVPSARNAIRTTLNRLWLGTLLHTDPDVAYFRSRNNNLTPEQKRLVQDLALITGFKATSDLPGWLSADELGQLKDFLQVSPQVEQLDFARFRLDGREVDFSEAVELPRPKSLFEQAASLVMSPLANQPAILQLNEKLGAQAVRRLLK